MRALKTEPKKPATVWTKFVQWLLFDLTPVLLLLLMMAWAMSLIPAGADSVKQRNTNNVWSMQP